MGHEQSNLNCKVNENNERHEISNTKEFFAKKKKFLESKEQSDIAETNFATQNVIAPKSPRTDLTHPTSQKNISSKSSRQVIKVKTFIPQHEAITKVSETAFKGSVKQKKFFVEEKLKSLAEIVQLRYNTSKHFPYSQILSLAESLVYSLAYMTTKKCNHHDFYPANIYYSEGRFKIINPLELPSSGFYLTYQRQRFSFLSPQLIIAILEETSEADLGDDCMSKSDVFAIGMILLEVCSLQPSSECYDEESYSIIDSVIKERLTKVLKVYTPVMTECINIMLQYEVEERIDPLTLAQLLHCKIENQKLVAMQMEGPKQYQQAPLLQHGPLSPAGFPGKKSIPPPLNMSLQQIRGPPPPPYMHQPFMMQNLNPNIIAVSMPNEQFTRIGPNNQGFLSSSSLQQKLRVIELIKEHPKEDDDEAQNDSKLQQNSEIDEHKEQKQPPQRNLTNGSAEKQEQKPHYFFVESIYSEKPLIEVNSQKNSQPQIERQILPENRQPISTQVETNKIRSNRQLYNPINPNLAPHTVHQFNQRKLQTFIREEPRPPLIQGYEDIKPKSPIHIFNEHQKPTIFNCQQQNYFKSDTYIPPQSFGQIDQKVQLKMDSRAQFMSSHSYGTSTSKNSPTINNIYAINQSSKGLASFGQIQNQFSSNQSGQIYTKKYGTSFQPSSTENTVESIDQRVQRVLNMSRNAK